MNSNYVQCKIKVSETWTDCAVGLATVADGSKARNIRHRLGSRRLVICASLSTGNGLASSTRRAVMIYVIRQTRRCCCNFLPLPLHLLCCRSTSPIDKCATFCAIKEKIFRAINHQRRRSWKRRREEPGAESKNSFVPSRSRERERESIQQRRRRRRRCCWLPQLLLAKVFISLAIQPTTTKVNIETEQRVCVGVIPWSNASSSAGRAAVEREWAQTPFKVFQSFLFLWARRLLCSIDFSLLGWQKKLKFSDGDTGGGGGHQSGHLCVQAKSPIGKANLNLVKWNPSIPRTFGKNCAFI